MPRKKKQVEPIEGVLIEKRKTTKYEPWMCDELLKVAEEGGHVAQMCRAIGIRSKDTFYRWLDEYPEFKEAYAESKLISQSFYEQVLLMGGMGRIKNYNFQSIITILNNKFPTDYKRTTSSGTEINIGSINSIEALDSKTLDEKINALQKKLGLLPTEEHDVDEESVL